MYLTEVNSLYSFPVCMVSVLFTSPDFTCFRAGFSFLGGLGACGMGGGKGGTSISSVALIEVRRKSNDSRAYI
jgi:hypothetical protein